MGIIQAVFFLVISIIAFHALFIKQKGEFLLRYLAFFLIFSFYINFIYHIKAALWVTLVCAAGLILNFDAPIWKKSTFLAAALLIFSLYRVPAGSSEFDAYLADEYHVYCAGIECLHVSEENVPSIQGRGSQITSMDFRWYFFWAEREIGTKDFSIKATNIMGFWLSDMDADS